MKKTDSIFIDGDFNNSYESRVRKATGKKKKMKLEKGKAEISDEEWLALLEKDYPPLAEEVKAGYKTVRLAPLKCVKCEHTEFKQINIDRLEGYGSTVCEYDEACKNCGHINGHWAYGNWMI